MNEVCILINKLILKERKLVNSYQFDTTVRSIGDPEKYENVAALENPVLLKCQFGSYKITSKLVYRDIL